MSKAHGRSLFLDTVNLYALTTSLPENNSDICESWLDVIADTGFSDQFSK
jgi:hypothetical protein